MEKGLNFVLKNFEVDLIDQELNKDLPYPNMKHHVRSNIFGYNVLSKLHVLKSRDSKVIEVEFKHVNHKNLFWRFLFESGLIDEPKIKEITFKKSYKLNPIFTNTHLSESNIYSRNYIQNVSEFKFDKFNK